MSKQSSEHPSETDETPHKSHKRRKGKYELWAQITLFKQTRWFKHRSYDTLERAQMAQKTQERQAHIDKTEIRIKDE